MTATAKIHMPSTERSHDVPTGLYINGSWVDLDEKFDVIDPSTGEVLARVSDGEISHGKAALLAAHEAQPGWAAFSPRARGDLLHDVHALLLDRSDAFIDLMVLESGKPRNEAAGEMALTLDFFRWFAEQAAHVHGSYARASRADFRIITTSQPVGPSLLITPWNFPVLLPARKVGAALAAGCTVILKPAAETPLVGALLAQVLNDAGLPEGVFNLIPTKTSAAMSESLMQDPRLRKVSFTGSSGVGSVILRQAADNVMSSQMELGGNGAFIVLDDADVDVAVDQAMVSKFRNSGQACIAANRIILQSGIAEEFTEKFLEATRKLVVGPGHQTGVDVGPMITEKQRGTIEGMLASAVGISAEVLLGGKAIDGDGFFFEPTVLRMLDQAPEFSCHELFAPVAALYTVDTVDEAVEFANRSEMGLAAYLFTRDLSRAITVAERIETGMVAVNRGMMADPAAPFGGVKASGIGREGGHEALGEFLETKYIALTV